MDRSRARTGEEVAVWRVTTSTYTGRTSGGQRRPDDDTTGGCESLAGERVGGRGARRGRCPGVEVCAERNGGAGSRVEALPEALGTGHDQIGTIC